MGMKEDLTRVVPGILRHDGDAQQGRGRIPRPRVPLAAPNDDEVDTGDELQRRRWRGRTRRGGRLREPLDLWNQPTRHNDEEEHTQRCYGGRGTRQSGVRRQRVWADGAGLA